ncbi:MAG: LysM peptidoglycan-binding domain-containing protein, partial [Deltaproteobacteria bacterium]|nr:LysM peptidoglycan-binding domain-containing protein [Deltaproteobacteria bacterium]
MIRQISRYCVLIVLAFVVLGAEDLARAAGVVTNMRHWTAPDHTRIVFDLTDPPVFTASRQDGVLAVTFRNMTWGETAPRETEFDQSRIGKLSISTSEEGDTLVRLEMANNVETNVFPLKKFMDKPDRLVIDIEFPEVSRRQSRMREQIKVSTDKKIIVIDPGHGGDDPGAVGKNGTYEKDVVLSISRRLKNNLDRHGFFQDYLTRDGDYYVPFNKRLQIAREFGADMFISVHADAARNREARGSSVYCLSSGEASSVAAKILAQNENLADIVGGSREADMKEETNPILINMCQTNTINISKAFGMNVLWELSNVGELKFDRVQEAPFRVLKMPEIPSVLIETAYISNLEEEKLLRSPAFQQKLADTIARAVVRFFLMEPGGEPPLLVQRPKTVGRTSAIAPKPAVFHTVVKGETLSKISREYGVPLRQLLKMNGMRMEDSLYVGKRLKIEEGGGESLAASGGQGGGKPSGRAPAGGGDHKAFFTYTVVKGDSLIRIGDRFGVTLESILALNGLKPGAPLHVGKRLKIEGTDPAVGTRQPGRTYRVKAGDTLLNIAKKQDVPVGTLLKLNGMKL